MRKIIIAALAALTMLIAAPASFAGNGARDFYLTGSCTPPNPYGARMYVTNYDSGSSGQVYHVSMRDDRDRNPGGSINIGKTAYKIVVGGSTLSSRREGYKGYPNRTRHTVVGYWKNPMGGYVTCSVSL